MICPVCTCVTEELSEVHVQEVVYIYREAGNEMSSCPHRRATCFFRTRTSGEPYAKYVVNVVMQHLDKVIEADKKDYALVGVDSVSYLGRLYFPD